MQSTEGIQLNQSVVSIEGIESDLELVFGAKGRKDVAVTDLSRVNEEDLYATIFYRDLKAKSPNAAIEFIKELPSMISNLNKTKGVNLVYKAADRVARDLVRKGVLAQELFREIKKRALGFAQLDGDKTWLNTERNEEATGTDTPLRSLKTVKALIIKNTELSEAQYALFRDREAKISREKWKAEVKGS